MVLTVPAETLAALQDADSTGIVPRYFVWIKARNTDTDDIEEIGVWNGNVPVSVSVVDPSTGDSVTREYQGIANLMQVPSIPMTMKLEVRSIKLSFTNLSPEILNAVAIYNPKNRACQIHRGLLDPATMNLVDPALCIFDGIVNKAPMKRAKAGEDGKIIIECQSHASKLARGKADKFSDEFFKRRGARQKYLDAVPRIVWGQKDMIKERKRNRKSKWISD